MKCFSIQADGREWSLVAAPTQKRAADLLGVSLHVLRTYAIEASPAEEAVLLANPETVFTLRDGALVRIGDDARPILLSWRSRSMNHAGTDVPCSAPARAAVHEIARRIASAKAAPGMNGYAYVHAHEDKAEWELLKGDAIDTIQALHGSGRRDGDPRLWFNALADLGEQLARG